MNEFPDPSLTEAINLAVSLAIENEELVTATEETQAIADKVLGLGELQRLVNIEQTERIAELEYALRGGPQDIYRSWR